MIDGARPDRRRALRLACGGLTAAALGGPLGGCGAGPVYSSRRAPDGPLRHIWTPQGPSRATILLVHGLGTRAAIWDLPGAGGLAPALARAGFEVIAPELDPGADLAGWRARLESIATKIDGPLFGVGLDLGGTALYGLKGAFVGRVGIGAPIASGGFSAAMRGVLTAPGAPTWHGLGRRTVGGRSVVRLLLTHGLPARIHRPLVRHGLNPMPEAMRRAWYGPGADSPVPELLPELPPPGPEWGPTLVVGAPTDGLAPPWQCDPRGFGLDWKGLRSLVASRLHGHGREFNHLDLVVHPDARRRLWPSIVRWLEETAAPA